MDGIIQDLERLSEMMGCVRDKTQLESSLEPKINQLAELVAEIESIITGSELSTSKQRQLLATKQHRCSITKTLFPYYWLMVTAQPDANTYHDTSTHRALAG